MNFVTPNVTQYLLCYMGVNGEGLRPVGIRTTGFVLFGLFWTYKGKVCKNGKIEIVDILAFQPANWYNVTQ